MAAIFAAAAGADTTLVERTSDGGRKILISGGGRCNILPARVDESRFVTDSPRHLLRRMLRAWPLHEQIAFFEREAGIPLEEELESGKLFPVSNRARDVRDRLLQMARDRGVRLAFRSRVTGLVPFGSSWRILREQQDPIDADRVVVSTGGLSVPSTGSDGGGLAIAGGLGHRVELLYPALTPLLATPAPFAGLSGLSVSASVTASSRGRTATASGGFLFTHRGYSGPAILDVSHIAVRSLLEGGEPASVVVRWAAHARHEWESHLQAQGPRTVVRAVGDHLPARLGEAIVTRAGLDARMTLSTLDRRARLCLVEGLVRTELPWNGDDGYKKAEVTGGGVSLSEVDPRSMESRRHRGLFLCGEMLDAFGPIGGYNFLWAWATGRAAGLGSARIP
jgi:predicted Rossmann fold flavoprotein